MPRTARQAVIIGANRIPFAKAGSAYRDATNQDMLTAALDGLIARYGLAGTRLDEVAAGAVLKHSKNFNLTRESVLGSALDSATPAYDVQRACATGLEAVIGVANKVTLGQAEVGVGGGVDSASDAPIVVSERLRKILLRLARAKTLGQRLKLVASIRPKDLAPVAPDVAEPRTGLSMGEHQALTTALWNISREAQDELALASHLNLAAAWERGFFDDLVTPYRRLTRDESLRPNSSADALAALAPVFGKRLPAPATMTAGNSTPLSDGASTVLLSSRSWARDHGLAPLATVVDSYTAAVDFPTGADGLLMGGAYAIPRILQRNNLTFADFDFVEIHEAFASTVLTTLAALDDDEFGRTRLGLDGAFTADAPLDRTRLNVTGSSLAAGHPFAATGGRIVGTLAKLLSERGTSEVREGKKPLGLISVCAAGGQATTMILEGA